MTDYEIKIRRLPHGQGLELPAYATAGAAGMDLLALTIKLGASSRIGWPS